ncbi:hypothetical protein [Croceibacterium atlanticum]|nr:hypothetical protein [Croceibacterium atlanticum]
MTAMDRPSARLEAEAWEVTVRAEWLSLRPNDTVAKRVLRQLHETILEQALGGAFAVHGPPDDDPQALGIEHELEKIAEKDERGELTEADEVQAAALQDALQMLRGKRPVRRRELEPGFAELADEYVGHWARQSGLKPSNTRQQKEATFRLFSGFFKDRPLRDVRRADASAFMDALRAMDPNWARSPAAKQMSWRELQEQYGGHPKGLSDATLNRHVTTLQELWKWGEDRDYCSGRNPFAGMRKRLTPGKNVQGYLPWEADELKKLFDPEPGRADVKEVMLVALFTGMRLDEIASLRFEQVREADGVPYIQVEDAKTAAGNRQVPLHPALGWLAGRPGPPGERLWPKFNAEGPGSKPGADAGKEFSRFKLARGFTDRRKTFHSFRKNVTQIMERAGVPENEWAQVLGHERGFTYSRYSPHGIALKRKAEIVSLIEYPGVPLPHPAS